MPYRYCLVSKGPTIAGFCFLVYGYFANFIGPAGVIAVRRFSGNYYLLCGTPGILI